jgi:hypothetical protein
MNAFSSADRCRIRNAARSFQSDLTAGAEVCGFCRMAQHGKMRPLMRDAFRQELH